MQLHRHRIDADEVTKSKPNGATKRTCSEATVASIEACIVFSGGLFSIAYAANRDREGLMRGQDTG